MKHAAEETTVIATFTARHDAEIARSYLEDQEISSFVIADSAHVSFQMSEGVRLVAMQHQAEEAVNALSEVEMGPESITSRTYAVAVRMWAGSAK